MKPQAFQPGELRDENDQIIRAGAYGKKTPFVSADNNAILDYIMNNFDALYAQIPNGRVYVKSVNNITPDSNGNVTINLGSGGGTGGTNITVDSTLSSASTNPVQNKVIYAALNNKLDKNGTATYATCDGSGNIISSTYARKTELSGYVKSINNVKPDGDGNVNISTGGTNVTPDLTPYMKKNADSDLMMGVHKLIFGNTVISDDFRNTVPMFTIDATGGRGVNIKGPTLLVNGIPIATETDLSKCVKSINNITPDSSGNVNISTSSSGTNITVDTALSGTSNNAISNKAVYEALSGKLDKTGTATAATKATQDGAGNVIATTYVKTVNNLKPDASGNVNISGGTGGNITVDSALSSTSTNAIQNRVVQQEFTSVRSAIPTKVSQLTNDSGYLTQHQSLDGYVKTSGQNTWRAQQIFNLATLGYEQYSAPYSSTNSVSPSTSAASYYATGAFTLNLSTLSALLGSNQSTVFSAYITASGDYALSITSGGTIKYIGEASDVAITSAGLLLNILMTKDRNSNLTSIVQANKLT